MRWTSKKRLQRLEMTIEKPQSCPYQMDSDKARQLWPALAEWAYFQLIELSEIKQVFCSWEAIA